MIVASFAKNPAVGRPAKRSQQLAIGAFHHRRKTRIKPGVFVNDYIFYLFYSRQQFRGNLFLTKSGTKTKE
jgi:hypothetical protein